MLIGKKIVIVLHHLKLILALILRRPQMRPEVNITLTGSQAELILEMVATQRVSASTIIQRLLEGVLPKPSSKRREACLNTKQTRPDD